MLEQHRCGCRRRPGRASGRANGAHPLSAARLLLCCDCLHYTIFPCFPQRGAPPLSPPRCAALAGGRKRAAAAHLLNCGRTTAEERARPARTGVRPPVVGTGPPVDRGRRAGVRGMDGAGRRAAYPHHGGGRGCRAADRPEERTSPHGPLREPGVRRSVARRGDVALDPPCHRSPSRRCHRTPAWRTAVRRNAPGAPWEACMGWGTGRCRRPSAP